MDLFLLSLLLSSFLLLSSCTPTSLTALPSELFSPLIAQKVHATSKNFNENYPQYTQGANSAWRCFSVDGWTSGFFPATLYEMNTRATLCPTSAFGVDWLSLGRQWSKPLLSIADHNTVEHDVGFISFPFQAELLVNPNDSTAKDAVNRFAAELAARYNPTVGCTRSWDTKDPTTFTVIMDNMMNLQVLYASAAITGNETLKNIAISHADKTIANHLRADGSSFHVVDYNAKDGQVVSQRTSQGYADDSTWSRGQAWGIHAFAIMNQNTGLQRYLETSKRMATYFLDHTPTSGIIPWDFNDPGNPPAADTSAAMIAANGYLLLAKLDSSNANKWKEAAMSLITSTTNFAWKPTWQSLLSNGTVNHPVGNSMTGIVYGDYYFVKAGNTLLQMGLASCS